MTAKNYLTKPFEIVQERNLFMIGTSILLMASIFAYLTHARFDGVIDMHIGSLVLWYQPLIDNIINTACLTLLMYLLSLLQTTKTRLIDLLNVALIARIPIYFILLTNLGGVNEETSNYLMTNITNPMAITKLPEINLIMLGISALVALGALVIFGILIYKGYKTATNSKQTSHLILLIPAVIIAEISSKLLVYLY
ncbi:MAG: hypothetical protein LBE34_09820 [Flavobacteriaceae bacterium]|jgi:hypothetical protein|nr:hypothetical protein [Flavobacteriaceae bacterium]